MKSQIYWIKKSLLLFLGVIAVSCQKDTIQQKDIETTVKSTTGLTACRIANIDSLFSKNQTLKRIISSKIKGKPSDYVNSKTSEIYEFSIDTSLVQLLTSSTYESFTFVVEREVYNPNVLENYVLTQYNNGDYSQLLISYPRLIINGETTYDIDGSIGQYIDDVSLLRSNPCPQDEVVIASWDSNAGDCIEYPCTAGGGHLPGEACNGSATEQPRIECTGGWVDSCVPAGVGSNDTGGGDSGNSGGSGSNIENEVIDGDGDLGVLPLEPDYVSQILGCINGVTFIDETQSPSIIETQLNSLTIEQQLEIKRYLLRTNNCSEEAIEFSILAIEVLIDGGEVDFEEEIIFHSTFDDFPCHKEVIREAISVCSPLTQVVLDVFEANDYVNLVFETSNTMSANASTTLFSEYDANSGACNITITFRESYLETATDLSIARTTVHESLHAILVYMYEEGLLQVDDETSLEGFEDILDAYIDYLSGLPANFGSSHHELMTEMVEDMATSLSSYGLDAGYSYPFSFYEKLCWGGLLETDSFNTLFPELIDPSLGNTPDNINFERYDIIYTIVSEQNNQTYNLNLNEISYEYSPKGNAPNSSEPCN